MELLELGWWQPKRYEVDNFEGYLGKRISSSRDLGVTIGLEGKKNQG